MTVGLNLLEPGDTIEIKGPLGSFIWTGKGSATWRGKTRKFREVGMVYGGSGKFVFSLSEIALYHAVTH